MNFRYAFALFAAVALMAGCEKKEEGGGAAASAKTEGAKGGTGDLPQACQDYIKKFDDCGKKIPEAGKAAWDQGGKAMKDSFAKANTPEAKKALESGCKTALDALGQNPMCK